MSGDRSQAAIRRLGRIFGWRRLVLAALLSSAAASILSPGWHPTPLPLYERALMLGLTGVLVFGVFEAWPRRLPRWLARWVLQVVGVALAMPVSLFTIYVVSTPPGAPPFWKDPDRLEGFIYLTMLSVLVAPWGALGGLVRQKEALAERQALAFALERSELERQALDARFRLIEAQVAPHFLFNTLANVQALVETSSPRAPEVLRHLTTYLRAAVARLDERSTTVGQEIELARAYLELMHMRMPDRLRFTVHADADASAVPCPPLSLLTLVENAIRHGIDPSEQGGVVDVEARRRDDRCVIRVRDSGVGRGATGNGSGTGLATLRERLRVEFHGNAHLRTDSVVPQGFCAEIDLPATERVT